MSWPPSPQWVALTLALVFWALLVLCKRCASAITHSIDARVPLAQKMPISLMIDGIHPLLLLAPAASAVAYFFKLTPPVAERLSQAIGIALLIQIGLWGSILVRTWFSGYSARKRADDPSSITALGLLSFLGRLLVWLVVTLLALAHVGVDVSALIAGLGIGGIAVALAVQNILGDLLASLSIILDKPFVVGDSIVVGDITGTVEQIGIKTTHIRALSGEQIIVPNSDLLKSRIRNFKRMHERRISFTVGVVYETPVEVIDEIPMLLKGIIESETQVRFDRAHLRSLGDSAIIFEVVYFVLSSDFILSMDIGQRIQRGILAEFQRRRIEFAFPTQTFVIKNPKDAILGS
jgi:small-conductance mechanosensitive channel